MSEQGQAVPLMVVIRLEPSQPERPWRATLLDLETDQRAEFSSPLELLQYLERLCRESGGRVVGIR
ncbi:hypothetical protein [Meiothermus taiwanensis]|uniref:Uncharacterized protein n=2 Tax=Meiothermus taiwanensis TaxID=172827 RepID=A0A399E0F7_9DEIN|nr:hypothetical protein [Meiothermus taiwanensis]AWR88053.1 hypothetical protein Mtai_v1c28290 [Meiothermus taiwanensis WR-220]KIQ54217.1 hypothetical protein SY28_09730 [Meiothermus taiwanensis]KZK15817.1 hypothetical protein A3962_08895 [Meiothermus taiwanensis]RIH77168.1 hypothetical protein Mcate_01421 [Meiothermus taiwanensis]